MMKGTIFIAISVAVAIETMAFEMTEEQERLERTLAEYAPREDGPYIPVRYRDAIADYSDLIARNGWSTNQFLEGLALAITNNLANECWANPVQRKIAEVAAMSLAEINNPSVTNFFYTLKDKEHGLRIKNTLIPALFWHTNLEPEVLQVLKTCCANTNVFDDISTLVRYCVYETLDTMPQDLKPSATNRVAKYMYFTLHHTTRRLVSQDRQLATFLPTYSNSFQRLSAMQYVVSTTTNLRTRTLAQQEVDRLSAIPTNLLNDISWIAEDLNAQ